MSDELRDRVLRGAALLDEKLPGWAAKIDLDRLEMSTCMDCVVGQLYDDFNSGLRTIGLLEQPDDEIDYGFDLRENTGYRWASACWAEINQLWRNQIAQRRAP